VQKVADCFASPVKRKKANLELSVQPGRSHLAPPCARHCAEAVRGLPRWRGAANARLSQPAIMVRGQPSGAYDDRTTLGSGFGTDDQRAAPQELSEQLGTRLGGPGAAHGGPPTWTASPMALDQGGIFRCELGHVSQRLDAEADPPVVSPGCGAGCASALVPDLTFPTGIKLNS
jgi:hypothetical protein